MPTIVSHAAVAIATGMAFAPKEAPNSLWPLAIACSIIPDADVVAFSVGIPYGHFFGHRGFFHSLFFAFLLSFFVVCLFCRQHGLFSKQWWFYLILFFMVSASHGILDAFTDGGLGIALLSPFDKTRYFFPWTPIMVSPIGIDGFFSRWGLMVIKSELLWIWLPCSVMVAVSKIFRVPTS